MKHETKKDISVWGVLLSSFLIAIIEFPYKNFEITLIAVVLLLISFISYICLTTPLTEEDWK